MEMHVCHSRLSMQAPAFLLIFLLVCCCSEQTGQLRSLGEIRHRFTSCSMSGRTGPSLIQCMAHYRSTSSASTGELLRQQISFKYEGAQYVQIPITAVYNVSVAGAAGGRGLCNPLFGRGRVVSAQAEFDKGTRMLIMVGQKGQGPCDLDLEDTFCPYITGNVTECEEAWREYLLQNDPLELPIKLGANRGGAGGGGASMIRLENEGGLQIFPFILAGAGGGGATLLDLDFVKSVNFSHSKNATLNQMYQEYMDGKVEEYDPVLSDHRSERGFVIETESRTPGAGGGYFTGNDESRRVDGSAFLTENDFGEGGRECASDSIIPIMFADKVGGFGGGGGGCGGGGGGGGHTGGAIVGISNTVPGGGGHSFVVGGIGAPSNVQYSLSNESRGYVEIVPADCGCVYECVVYEEEDQFECLCPNDTQLAPDLNDCYYTEIRDVSELKWNFSTTSGEQFSLLEFGNHTHIFSINVALAGTGACAIAFIDEDEDITLVSEPARQEEMVTLLSAVNINWTDGSVVTSKSTSFLPSAVLVTGAILVSEGECTVQGPLTMNVSLRSPINGTFAGFPTLKKAISENQENIGTVFQQILKSSNTSMTSGDGQTQFAVIVALSVVAGVVVLILLVTVTLTVVVCRYYHHRKRKAVLGCVQKIKMSSDLTSSLIDNAAYARQKAKTHIFADYQNSKKTEDTVDERYSLPRSLTLLHSQNSLSEMKAEIQQPAADCGEMDLNSPNTVIPPHHDFFNFNRTRCNSALKDRNWQYPRSNLAYMREIGEGQFGKVLLMKAENIAGFKGKMPVAVKTLSSRDPERLGKFLEEADIMKKFSHPNIVSLLGVSTSDLHDDDNAPLIILEYMSYGDLLAFLQKHRPTTQRPNSILDETHFLSFSTDVARAMEFIAQQKYIHRDLAARNCLVGTGMCIKIADFGLARKVHSYFQMEGNCILPVRSMAPECFISGKFTKASDVWSYGVLLWEIVTFGAPPLPGMPIQTIVDKAQAGELRHLIPLNCPPLLGSLIFQCHRHQSERRPTFSDILTQLTGRDRN